MGAVSSKIRREVLFWSALYTIPIFIVSFVILVDLYINVQRWRYDCLTIHVRSNITKWLDDSNVSLIRDNSSSGEDKNEHYIHQWILPNYDTSFTHTLKLLIRKYLYPGIGSPNENTKSEDNIKYGLQIIRAEIESLKAEKTRLESLNNQTRLGFTLGLNSPSPDQINEIYFPKGIREQLIRTDENELLVPEKPNKTHPSIWAEKDSGENEWNGFFLSLLDKFQQMKTWFLSKPVIADVITPLPGDDEFNWEYISSKAKKDKHVHIDLDSSTEFLLENF